MVHLEEDDPVPCDLVVLSTSHPHSQCYVMTANLDGETSLKTKRAATLTKTKNSASDLAKFVGYVECENPNPKLDNFVGRLTDEDARWVLRVSVLFVDGVEVHKSAFAGSTAAIFWVIFGKTYIFCHFSIKRDA